MIVEEVRPYAGKRCSCCRQTKGPDAFTRDRSSYDFLSDRCRRCSIEGQRVGAFRKQLLKMAIYERSATELEARLERFKADNAAKFDEIAARPKKTYIRRSPRLIRQWGPQ